jgi:hypothetical protein
MQSNVSTINTSGIEKYKLDHQYRMKQLELGTKLACEKEKTKQLELQIKLLKLQKGM